MENLEISHDILIAGFDFESCRKRVSRFFASTMLVRYDEALVIKNESVNGTDQNFQARIEEGLAANQQVVADFLASLQDDGFVSLADLQRLEKGYQSKILHTIAHLQDGFIGIDSRFYNMEEDSHGISPIMQKNIASVPGKYWILKVTGKIAAAGEDPFDTLRTFEWKGEKTD